MAKIKICLDAGHYGKYNRSPANKAYYESDMNWKLHNLLKKYLEQYGIEVIQTRSNQATDLALTSRGNAAAGCNLFLSIHSNAVGSGVNENVDYPVVYVPLNGTGDTLGKKLAECIEKTMGTKQKGKTESKKGNNGDYYGVIRGAVAVGVPGLILEHSFHTNTKMTNWLLDDKNLDKMAQAEAAVIAAHYGLEKAETEGVKTVNIEMTVLKKGAKGEQVKALQALLIGYGYKMENNGKTYGIDGSFGTATLNALKKYQEDNGLDVDGSVGRKTWTKLLKG